VGAFRAQKSSSEERAQKTDAGSLKNCVHSHIAPTVAPVGITHKSKKKKKNRYTLVQKNLHAAFSHKSAFRNIAS
jgi:hypothetical protein